MRLLALARPHSSHVIHDAVQFDRAMNGETTGFRFAFASTALSTTHDPRRETDDVRARVDARSLANESRVAASELEISVVHVDCATWIGERVRVHDIDVVRACPWAVASTLGAHTEGMDVVRGVYEGGLKMWECASDLASFIARREFEKYIANEGEVSLFELGAGHGLPSLVCARALRGRARALTTSDYNEDVAREVTIPNALGTMDLMREEGDEPPREFRCLCGDWGGYHAFVSAGSVDVALSSDSVYDVDAYDGLCGFLAHALSEDGVCFLAAKSYYFGVGGGTHAFSKHCERFGLRAENAETLSDGKSNVREILIIRKVKPAS